MTGLLQELRYAVRSLIKAPGFTTVAVLTLALGIGANTTLFSMLDAVLLKPLPFQEPDRVVEISGRDSERSGRRVPEAIVEAIRAKSATIEAIAIHGPDGGALRTTEGPVRIFGRHVSANYLNVLGVQPFIGRGFLPQEGEPAAPAVAVVSERFWQTRLAGDQQAVGRPIYINDIPHTVVGVMPSEFATSFQRGGDEFWTPYIREKIRAFEREEGHELIARLSPGVTIDEARRELQAIATSVDVPDPDWRGQYVDLVSKKKEMIGDSARALQLLLIAVAVVLMIACANLALLSLARADRRAAEFATRKAIGAPTSQLFRLALTESVLISAVGAIAGIVLSHWLLPAMLAFAPAELPRISKSAIDRRVLGIALALGVATACAFGAAPALRLSRLSVVETMKGLRGTPSARSARFRAALVTGQVAASVALLVLAGLIGRTFLTLLPSNPGFESTGRTIFLLSLPAEQFSRPADRWRALDELRQRLEATPGIAEAGFGLNVPFGGDDGFRFVRDFQQADPTDQLYVDVRSVSTNFFRLFNMPLRRGRHFTAGDRPESEPRVAIVNETLARRLARGGDVLGRRVQIGGTRTQPAPNAPLYEIVGVVADARSSGATAEIWDEIYVPLVQSTPSYGYVVVRSELDSGTLDRVLRKEIRALFPQWIDNPLLRATSMEELVDQPLSAPRFSATLITAFSANALLLTAIGVFGLVAYSVSQRRPELGIRAALGARSRDLLVLTMRSAVISTAVGVAIGLAGAAYLTQFIESQLYGIEPGDASTFIASAVMMLAIASMAAYIPSRRAARVDPLIALRYE
jgi:putative ABC transport system permease protein